MHLLTKCNYNLRQNDQDKIRDIVTALGAKKFQDQGASRSRSDDSQHLGS